ncbi:MAG TPA: ABC transporter permease [Candidatus Polarisedimenticolia bacterium]|nr:ABC transporter permease [Candidatus Polarisedimenticolia bacterium]
MRSPVRELRHAFRELRKDPVWTGIAVATLALSMGANTAVFSIVNAVLVRPLPYLEPNRIMQVWGSAPARGLEEAPLSHRRFLGIARQSSAFEAIGAYTADTINLTGVREPRQLSALRVSPGVLDVLRVRPARGRNFRGEEEQPGGAPVVLLSDALWRHRFGSDPRILGKPVSLDGIPRAIVGVLPAGFVFPDGEADVWIPRVLEPSFLSSGAVERGSGYLSLIARLKPGVSIGRAQAELDVIAAREPYSEGLDADLQYRIVPMKDQMVSGVRPTLLVLLVAVGFVLLIACANVANLLLARSTGRRREMAVRAVLGASPRRLMLQTLSESLVLSTTAALAGLLIATWGLTLLVSRGAGHLPRNSEIRLDGGVLAVTGGLALFTGLIFGMAPALYASRTDLNEVLRDAGPGSIGGPRGLRIRALLVVAEVALAVVLLIGAGLLMRSFVRLLAVDIGFRPGNLLSAKIDLAPSKYAQPAQRREFYRRLSDDLGSLPGALSVGAAETLPLGETTPQTLAAVPGLAVPPPGERAVVPFNTVTPGYFRTLGIPLRKGRGFREDEDDTAPITVVISESFARRFFPDADPIGRHVVLGKSSVEREIVGIVGDVRLDGLETVNAETFYLSANQRTISSLAVVIRTAGEPRSLMGAVRRRMRDIDPDQPVANLRTMEEVIGGSMAGRRYILILAGLFASLALALAALGIYSVTAYSVSQRTPEIGLRIALGARPVDVLRLVMTRVLALTLAGVGLGLAAALGVTRLLSSLLFGVTTGDPLTFAAIPLLLSAVSVVASCLPALRAIRIDPLTALRDE